LLKIPLSGGFFGLCIGQREIREHFLNAGLEPVDGTPDELAAAMKNEIDRLGSLIREAGIRAD